MVQSSKSSTVSLRPRPGDNDKDIFTIGVPPLAKQLGIEPRTLCQLEKDGKVFVGRASQVKTEAPKTVQVSQGFKEMHGLSFAESYELRKGEQRLEGVERVTLEEVGDDGDLVRMHGERQGFWEGVLFTLLYQARYLAVGMRLDGILGEGVEKCFRITKVVVGGKVLSHPEGRMYKFEGPTKVEIGLDGEPRPSWALEDSGMAGLDTQLATLRREMERFRHQRALRRNHGVIIHGASGTGKTTLIEAVAQAPWRKVFRPELDLWKPNFSREVKRCFWEASQSEPSLVILDSNQAWFENPNIAYHLEEGFRTILNKRVLVLAASKNVRDIPEQLRGPGCLEKRIETAVPDSNGRTQILKAMCKKEQISVEESVLEGVGAKTHGYTGKDLQLLLYEAIDFAKKHTLKKGLIPEEAQANGTSKTPEHSEDEDHSIPPSEEHFQAALEVVRPSAMDEIFLETPKVSWEDVGGQQNTKDALTEALLWPAKYLEDFRDLDIPSSKGMLLYGPPGCSKTLTAAAIANESGLNFLAVKGAEVLSMYVGESERKVRDIFNRARAARPSILFFDEIDAIGAAREGEGSNSVQVLTTILNEMDGIEVMTGVFVLAATNKPWKLDPALMRPGRFDKLIYVPLPDEETRRDIFRVCMRKVKRAEVDVEELARKTDGFSGAEIASARQEACMVALRRKLKSGNDSEGFVRQQDFEEALKDSGRMTSPESVREYEEWASRIKRR